MIFDNVKNRENYREMKDLYTVLCFLAAAESLPEGRVELRGEEIFANPVSLVSKPAEECVFEAHRRYADVHYILSGAEGIAVRDVGALEPLGGFEEERDIGFYRGEAACMCYLHPGDFMVCFARDAHKVAMMDKEPGEIRKIVAKVLEPGQRPVRRA